jgi:chaperonin GroEL
VGRPTITNDGVSIAKEIELDDPYEKIGAELVKEVAKKTDDVAGDGTTTATVLAQALVREGLRNVAAGADPISLKRASRRPSRRSPTSCSPPPRRSRPRRRSPPRRPSPPPTPRSASSSPRRSTRSARKASSPSRSRTPSAPSSSSPRACASTRATSPLLRHRPGAQEAVFEDPYILIANQKISNIKDLLPIVEKVIQEGKELVIIAEDVEGEASRPSCQQDPRHLQVGRRQGPGFGDRRKAMLQDIAILTGGQVITEEVGLKLENATTDLLGKPARSSSPRTRPRSSRAPASPRRSRAA